MKEASRKINKDNFNMKKVEKLSRKASRKLNKDNSFKSYSTNLFNNHTMRGTNPTTMINLQGASILPQKLTHLTLNSMYKEIKKTKRVI